MLLISLSWRTLLHLWYSTFRETMLASWQAYSAGLAPKSNPRFQSVSKKHCRLYIFKIWRKGRKQNTFISIVKKLMKIFRNIYYHVFFKLQRKSQPPIHIIVWVSASRESKEIIAFWFNSYGKDHFLYEQKFHNSSK